MVSKQNVTPDKDKKASPSKHDPELLFKDSTESLVQTLVVVGDEMSIYATEGKDYPTLCLESAKFRSLFKILNSLNEKIKLSDQKRKEAIKNCPRPSSKRVDEAFRKRVQKMSDEDLNQLRQNKS
jgi:uncharacterized protein YdcH (DUF465 family)